MTPPHRLLLPVTLLCLAPAASFAAGDAARGERVFQRCYSCHSVEPNETNLQGPNLRGVVGRKAGALPGFEFSPAMIAAGQRGLVWTPEALDTYLVDPEKTIPGTMMGGVRLDEPADRADLIAYLKKNAD